MTSAIDRTTPIGLYNFGVAYLDTARLALAGSPQPRFAAPIEFLCAHGLELIFKADLSRSMEVDDIRKTYGHNLVELRKGLSVDFVKHFNISCDIDRVIYYLAIGHCGPNWENRFIVTGVKQHIPLSEFITHLAVFDDNDRAWLSAHFRKVRA